MLSSPNMFLFLADICITASPMLKRIFHPCTAC